MEPIVIILVILVIGLFLGLLYNIRYMRGLARRQEERWLRQNRITEVMKYLHKFEPESKDFGKTGKEVMGKLRSAVNYPGDSPEVADAVLQARRYDMRGSNY